LVYLAELLVVTTDRLKNVRIHARNVPRNWTQTRLSNRKTAVSRARCRSVERQKIVSKQLVHVWQ